MTVVARAARRGRASALRGELTNATAVAGVLAAAVGRSTAGEGSGRPTSPWPARPGR